MMLGGSLWLGGMILELVASAFHAMPPNGDPNDHPATFPGIADSDAWGAVHFGEFAAAWIVIAGLIVLFRALELAGRSSVLGRLGIAAAIAAGAAVAGWLAIDGIAPWASAPASAKVGAFQNAEIVRWVEAVSPRPAQ